MTWMVTWMDGDGRDQIIRLYILYFNMKNTITCTCHNDDMTMKLLYSPANQITHQYCHCGLEGIDTPLEWNRLRVRSGSAGYISNVQRAYDCSGLFGVLWVHMARYKNCVKKTKFLNAKNMLRRNVNCTRHSIYIRLNKLFIYLFIYLFSKLQLRLK